MYKKIDILILACLWSPTAICLKYLSNELPPITIVACSSLLSALITNIFTKNNIFTLPLSTWKHCSNMGLMGHAIPFVLLAYSMHYMQSIWMGILTALVPVITCLFANILLPCEKLNKKRSLGILLGFISALIILASSYTDNQSDQKTGIILGMIAAVCYASNLIYTKKYAENILPLVRSNLMITTSLCYLLPISLIIDQPFSLQIPSITGISAILFLGIPGTAIAFTYYHKIISHSGPTMLSMVNYILPILKTILGVIFLQETLTMPFCFAIILIIISLKLVTIDNNLNTPAT